MSGRVRFFLASGERGAMNVKYRYNGSEFTVGGVDEATISTAVETYLIENPPAVEWGSISGDIAAQADVQAAFKNAYRAGPMMMKPANNEYVGNILTGTLTTLASAAGRQDIAPYLAAFDFTIDQMGMSVSTASAGSACGLIFDADANGRPAQLLAQSANIDTGTTGTKFGPVSFSFQAGKLYWLGNWTSAACTLRCAQTYSNYTLTWTGAATPAREAVLRRVVTFGEQSTDWVYAAGQHTGASAPFVLMRISG